MSKSTNAPGGKPEALSDTDLDEEKDTSPYSGRNLALRIADKCICICDASLNPREPIARLIEREILGAPVSDYDRVVAALESERAAVLEYQDDNARLSEKLHDLRMARFLSAEEKDRAHLLRIVRDRKRDQQIDTLLGYIAQLERELDARGEK